MDRDQLAFIFGILGIVSYSYRILLVRPTFKRIVKEKSTQGFQSVPYSVALFSATLYIYYAFLKTDDSFMLITINSFGCLIESSYLALYLFYASSSARWRTAKLMAAFNALAYGAIVLTTTFAFNDHAVRVNVVGWICAVFSVCVFAAPLNIIRDVIKTKSVEFMPFCLSLFLTVCAAFWLVYGLALEDYYIAAPNILGLAFGFIQMGLYWKYYDGESTSQVLPVIHTPTSTRSEQDQETTLETETEDQLADANDDEDVEDDEQKRKKIKMMMKKDIIISNNLDAVVDIARQNVIFAVAIAMSASEEETDEELNV
ncbi:Bidirectional sugar transporter SWEET14 [Linum perenne]